MKFVIDRREWLRGDSRNSMLLRPSDKKKCCLGIFGIACGLKEEIIDDQGDFSAVLNGDPSREKENYPHEIKDLPEPLRVLVAKYHSVMVNDLTPFRNSSIANELIRVNDDETTDDSYKENMIKTRFKEIGVEVEFTN